MSLLSVKNLKISLQGKALVDGVSFDLKEGEVLCIVGESGSGKTLSVLSVMGLLPDEMDVSADMLEFGGENLKEFKGDDWRSIRGAKSGMIFQEPMTSLNPVMTVGQQVAEVFEIHTDLSHEEIHAKVIELFERVQIKEAERRFHAYPHQLSGGQRQRVMIAMALALEPKLLIADEPTTALDVTVQGEILQLIKHLQKDLGTAVLFVTHDFGVVSEMADRVMVMQHGEMVEVGKVKALMEKPKKTYTKDLLAAMPKLVKDKKTKKPSGTLLDVNAVSKTFMVKQGGFFSGKEPFKALDNVSFKIGKGEVLGLVGESGCGKSTLAKCIMRLYEPEEGNIVFDGADMSIANDNDIKVLRRQVQMVFQDPFSSLNPRMKVGESIGEGVRAHKLMNAAERKKHVKKLLKDCGLSADSYDRYPHQFSGGQRQRICIARALAMKPSLIIADEPVSALDVSVQKQILELLNDLKEKYNLSYLFISHDLRVVSALADRVLVMKDGQIVEQGNVAQVFSKPKENYTKQMLAAIPQ